MIDYVTTIEVAEGEHDDDADDEHDEPDVGAHAGGTTDLRYALQALTQMARAQADSLRAVTEAQADWVKGLAHAKALPRNAMVVAPSASLAAAGYDGTGDDSEDDCDSTQPAPPAGPQPADWVVGMQAAEKLGQTLAPTLGAVAALLMKRFGRASSESSPRSPTATANPTSAEPTTPTASPAISAEPAAAPSRPPRRNPMIHLAEINAGLSAEERRFLEHTLRSREGEALAAVLLSHDIADAIAVVVDAIAQVRASRVHVRAQAARTSSGPEQTDGDLGAASDGGTADAHAVVAAASGATGASSNAVAATPPPRAATTDPVPEAFMTRVMAVAALLDPGQQAAILALLPQLTPDRLQQLQRDLLAMTAEDAAAWIRQNLPALCAEVQR